MTELVQAEGFTLEAPMNVEPWMIVYLDRKSAQVEVMFGPTCPDPIEVQEAILGQAKIALRDPAAPGRRFKLSIPPGVEPWVIVYRNTDTSQVEVMFGPTCPDSIAAREAALYRAKISCRALAARLPLQEYVGKNLSFVLPGGRRG